MQERKICKSFISTFSEKIGFLWYGPPNLWLTASQIKLFQLVTQWVTNCYLTFAESALYLASRNNNNWTTERTTNKRHISAGKSIGIKNLQKIKRDSSLPDHFFALISRQKNMKPSGFASCTAGALHGTTCRFILLCAWHARGVQDTKCFIKAWRWSIVSLKLHNMKQLHFIQLWSIRFAHMM